MPRITREKQIIFQVLNDPFAQIEEIPSGRDGKKFDITTSRRLRLFCRVKENAKHQELPNQEIEILNTVNSDHVIKPISATITSNYHVILFPFIEGKNLEERLREGEMSETEIRRLTETLLEVVGSMDEAGVAHFDIKPANIMVGTSGDYYLVDFGTARFLRNMRDERIFPARKFIAPEVLEYLFKPNNLTRQRLNTLSDMYGVGAVLYSCITGRNVSEFFGSSYEVLQKTPPPVRTLKPDFDPTMSELVDLLLSKKPADRLRANDARALLSGGQPPALSIPKYLMKTKPGRGSDHKSVLDAIYQGGAEVGIYWVSEEPPQFPKKMLPYTVVWETPVREDDSDLERDLLDQYQKSAAVLCVPGLKLINPVNSDILSKNGRKIDVAVQWRRRNATRLPLFAVVPIEISLLNSAEIDLVKDAYAAKNLDGIILRTCVPNRGTSLNVHDLQSIKDFIEPWATGEKQVLFDGDLSVLPLTIFGVSGLISKTYPRLDFPRQESYHAHTPDGIFLKEFLSIISKDAVLNLRRNGSGRAITSCDCPYCSTLMQNDLWDRKSRRKHFIYTVPKEISEIKRSGAINLQRRIVSAQSNFERFGRLTGISSPHLQIWLDLLQNT